MSHIELDRFKGRDFSRFSEECQGYGVVGFERVTRFAHVHAALHLCRGERRCAASVRGLGGSGGAIEAGRRRRTWRGTP